MDSLTTRFQKEVFLPYLDFVKAGYRFHPIFSTAKKIWEEKLTEDELINGPYLEKANIYQVGASIEELPLHEKTKVAIKKRLGSRSLWKHQTDAIQLVLSGASTVVATGTSSGKTLCYQIPILDDLNRNPSKGLRAVIIYPLNALVNDQLTEWERLLSAYPEIRFARFTGQTPSTQIDYVAALKETFLDEYADKGLTQQELQQKVKQRVAEKLKSDEKVPNRLNHRDDIRSNPPQILITNFSMLEYLLERPVDAPIFNDHSLKFIVLDEAHAYRGVQSTEIAFLIRRLKDRLRSKELVCIATSATLGKQDDVQSQMKVRKFATDLFKESFNEPNPVYGASADPIILGSAITPTIEQYISIASDLRSGVLPNLKKHFGDAIATNHLLDFLSRDHNLFQLRKEILKTPTLLKDAAEKLWPKDDRAVLGLEALLEIVGTAASDETVEDILPTRLHYFVRAQDGLHVCLHKECPGRKDNGPAFFVSRKNDTETPEGECPDCFRTARRKSKLVEIVACRKCGYLFGALQDLGPRRWQNETADEKSNPPFDVFNTELGWATDSYWTYFSVDTDLPYPSQPLIAEDEDDEKDLFLHPDEVNFCVTCGKKHDLGRGDNCTCETPHVRSLKIFHRQCPHYGKSKDIENAGKGIKVLLPACPNCGARNGSGIEPVHRFQESDDEMGIAMAIPLAHFQVGFKKNGDMFSRKLLCFTDHRQRAAAFPSLLEEETFAHDMGRKILEILEKSNNKMDLVSLGEALADEEGRDPRFFLPTSRFPDEEINADPKARRNLWLAETFAYFGVPDSARESAEDFGLVSVEYQLKDYEKKDLNSIFSGMAVSPQEVYDLIQILLGYMRQRKAFTMPKGVPLDAPAFGRVTADISYMLQRKGIINTTGWLPSGKKNIITDFLCRSLKLSNEGALSCAEKIWGLLVAHSLLIETKERWKLNHQNIFITKPKARHVCDRCGAVSAYSVKGTCPRKACEGPLKPQAFDPTKENLIARWVAGMGERQFFTLKSEEHTAQIKKDIAKRIEDSFRSDGVDLPEGVNLLSSTTTFEMGINIGDLQKVLLRNAPPTSANYVQRVGRAGRGKDKNSVCVTLCRRTKYDLDSWNEPPRLMSGVVRAPTVFIQNYVIAQRHFNAVVFSAFLRLKIADERILGQIKQQIRLESFIPLEARNGIPEGWIQIRPTNIYLDFLGWLEQKKEIDLFFTDSGQSLLTAVGGFENGKRVAAAAYSDVLKNISSELSALMDERHKVYVQGGQISDIEQAIKNLLANDVISILAKRGFLPRYAFPLDVVTLETGKTRWSRDADVELSRDRGIAIAEFAPGAQVIARKKVFASAGLYVISKMDRPSRKWYSECSSCKQIRTEQVKENLIGPCAVCGKSITSQFIKPFVEPLAFSVRIDEKQGVSRYRRSTLIRQRQSLTHFIDHIEESNFHNAGLFHLALKESGTLFRYNLGPKNEGFILCQNCGCSEPHSVYRHGKKHKKLRSFGSVTECPNDQLWVKLAYGHQFQSYCLIARPAQRPDSIESLAYALQRGLCLALDLETSDIGVSWRWRGNTRDESGCEIIFYDQTPGGAGFVKEAFGDWKKVTIAAIQVCKECNCEHACYDCLKSYSNQSQHQNLNRLAALSYLERSSL